MDAYNRAVRSAIIVIAVILVLAALRASYAVSMPLAFACFLAVIVWPLQKWLMQRMNKWVSFGVVVLLVAAGLAFFIGLVWFGASQLASEGPALVSKLQQRVQDVQGWAQERGLPATWDQLQPQTALNTAWTWITTGMASLWSALALIGVVLIFLILLLAEAEHWPVKVREAFPADRARSVLQTTGDVVRALERYLLVRLCISVLSGVLVFGWCMLLGIDLAVVWGLTTFVFNFVPNIGSILSYGFPALAAFVQHDWRWALLTLACIAATDLVVGNFLEPRLQGRSLRLSPFVILVAVVFWGWMWGIAGMMLAVPMTASLTIILLHLPRYQSLGKLLGRPRHEQTS